ncbi:MAG: helix-turn-helix transcriptional regulator [Paraglaciecola sp.]|uniref:AraC family transcriptional regulator n=1 Tax=Paraglaciecola sp. TaxID=1920173 RepID=UPI0032993E89
MKSSVEVCVVDRQVIALEDQYPAGFVDDWHYHSRAQLIYTAKGLLTVFTETGTFVLPPQRALWIPAGIRHMVRCRSDISLCVLYINTAERRNLPEQCRILIASDLLRALILQAMKIPAAYEVTNREGHIMQLILDEIEQMPIEHLVVPMPNDSRLHHVCSAFMQEPSQEKNLTEWADLACMSRRTFTRLFRKETNMSFSSWRQYARLLEALSRLSTGEQVTKVAFDVGYNSSSAFTSMFHRAFGVPPSKYFER